MIFRCAIFIIIGLLSCSTAFGIDAKPAALSGGPSANAVAPHRHGTLTPALFVTLEFSISVPKGAAGAAYQLHCKQLRYRHLAVGYSPPLAELNPAYNPTINFFSRGRLLQSAPFSLFTLHEEALAGTKSIALMLPSPGEPFDAIEVSYQGQTLIRVPVGEKNLCIWTKDLSSCIASDQVCLAQHDGICDPDCVESVYGVSSLDLDCASSSKDSSHVASK